MSESRARQRIRKAVESRGCSVLSMEWEPWYVGGEMSGVCGGWTVVTDAPLHPNTNYGDEATGLNVEEVLADIDWSIHPTGPCDCPDAKDPRHRLGTRCHGMPRKPIHEPDCRWRITYRLPWWDDPCGCGACYAARQAKP